MAAGRFVEVSDKEISEIKMNSDQKNTKKHKNTKTIIRLRLGDCRGIFTSTSSRRIFPDNKYFISIQLCILNNVVYKIRSAATLVTRGSGIFRLIPARIYFKAKDTKTSGNPLVVQQPAIFALKPRTLPPRIEDQGFTIPMNDCCLLSPPCARKTAKTYRSNYISNHIHLKNINVQTIQRSLTYLGQNENFRFFLECQPHE
jgi:hypothetical protein